MKPIIIPVIFSKDMKEFCLKLDKLTKISKMIQIDIADGIFVKHKSIKLEEIPNLKKYKNSFAVNLMTINPGEYINNVKEKGFKKVIFHYESLSDIEKIKSLSFLIQSLKMESWVAFNPRTNFTNILGVIDNSNVDGIMIVSSHHEKTRKGIDVNAYRRISNLKKSRKVKVQIDGGVSDENLAKLIKEGADIISSGKFIFDSEKPEEALEKLNKIA